MELFIKEQLYVKTKNQGIIQELTKLLDKPNPEYAKKKAMGYSVHNIDPRIKMYKLWKDGIIIPRGTGRIVRDIAAKYHEQFEYIDERTNNNPIEVTVKEHIESIDYQDRALESMHENQQGLIVAPCSAGKTVIGLRFIAEKKQATLIVVHTKELFTQWYKEIFNVLDGDITVGRIGAGHKHHGDITIATVQTLKNLSPSEWQDIRRRYSILLGDEFHHAGANSYITIMQNIQSMWMFGLTATPKRKDKKDFVIRTYLGLIIHEINDEELEEAGRKVSCQVHIVKTGREYNFTELGDNYNNHSGTIAKDLERNKKIVDTVLDDLKEGRTPMLLTERVIHAKMLKSMLQQHGFKIGMLTGETEDFVREKVKTDMKKGKLDGLIANKIIAAEGLDIPRLDNIHVCFWTTNPSLLKQMIGRGRRTFEDKEYCKVRIYADYVFTIDLDHVTLEERIVEHNGFKYGISRITKWCKEQGFKVIYDV